MTVQDVWRRLTLISSHDATGKEDEGEAKEWQEEILWLEGLGKSLAQSEETRRGIFSMSLHGEQERLHALRSMSDAWLRSATLCANDAEGCAEEKEREEGGQSRKANGTKEEEGGHMHLQMRKATLLARVVRNAVADHSQAQGESFIVVSHTLSALWLTTSFALEARPDAQLLMRTLVQMLSNLVTENDALQHQLWSEHLQSTTTGQGRSGIELLCRLLNTPDKATQSATQVLLLNLVMANPSRTSALGKSKAWLPVLRALLHTIDASLEDDEVEEEEAEAESQTSDGDSGYGVSLLPSSATLHRQKERYESLGIIYALFVHLFQQSLFDDVFAALASSDHVQGSTIDASLITSSQINLLKMFDAFLHGQTAMVRSQELAVTFIRLSRWANETMERSMKDGPSAPVDGRLVEVHIGFILILQCLLSILMAAGKNDMGRLQRQDNGQVESEAVVEQVRSDEFVTSLLQLMRTTSAFSPAITPFKPSAAAQQAASQFASAPEGHVYSSTGKALMEQQKERKQQHPRPELDKLKRDMMGLLGALTFQRGQFDVDDVRRVQDVVRESGGLLVVLNLTQLDERNPYIRERAIFALRNLLNGNQASQNLIAQLQPVHPAK